MRRSRITTATAGWTFIFASTTTIRGSISIAIPCPISTHEMGLRIICCRIQETGVFEDVTEAAGLNVDNDRYSFACSWGDVNGDGWPDLYVVNDFGRNVLYRNQGGWEVRRRFARGPRSMRLAPA